MLLGLGLCALILEDPPGAECAWLEGRRGVLLERRGGVLLAIGPLPCAAPPGVDDADDCKPAPALGVLRCFLDGMQSDYSGGVNRGGNLAGGIDDDGDDVWD
jgi:hypothetical protein